MKLAPWNLALLSLVLAAGAAPAPVAPGGSDKVFSFREPPINSLGVKSMADLHGKPVVIDFWGYR